MPLNEFLYSYSLFVLQVVSLLVSSFLLVGLIHRGVKGWERFVLIVLYSYGLVIVLTTLLGAFGVLFYEWFWAGLVFVNGVLGVIWGRRRRRENPRGFFTGAIGLLKRIFGCKSVPGHGNEENFDFDWKVFLIYLPLIAFLILKVINALHWQIMETDSLVYHMPFAVKWFQTGSIWQPYYTAYSGPLGYYPGNFELLYLFTFWPFGADFLVKLINFPLLPAFGGVLYLMARQFGLGERRMGLGKKWLSALSVAAIAPAIFIITPMIIRQAGIPQNDLFYIFTFAVAVYYALKIWRERAVSWGVVVPMAVALGLFAGTKSAGAIYGGIFLIVVGILIWRVLKEKKEVVSAFWKFLGGILGLSFLSGGFWYLRNLVLTGNPLFPLHLEVGGVKILQGYEPMAEFYSGSRLIANLNMISFREFFESGIFSFGPLFLILFVLPFVAFFVYLRRRDGKPQQERRRNVLIFSALAIFCFFIYLITPFTSSNIYPNIRYMLPMLLFSYLVLLVVQKRGWWLFYALSLANFGLIYFQRVLLEYLNDYVFYDFKWTLSEHFWLLAVLGMAFFALGMAIFYFKEWKKKAAVLMLFVVLTGIVFQRSFIIREARGDDAYTAFTRLAYHATMFESFRFVNENLPEGARVAFTMGASHYMLFGPKWSREVDYININDCQGCDYADYKTSEDSILRDPSYEEWYANLKVADKQYLVILFKYFPEERKVPQYELNWALKHPENFEKIFNEGETWVFEVK